MSTSSKAPVTFNTYGNHAYYYNLNLEQLKNVDKALKFINGLRQLPLKLEIPSEEEIKTLNTEELDKLVSKLWSNYYLLASETIKIMH